MPALPELALGEWNREIGVETRSWAETYLVNFGIGGWFVGFIGQFVGIGASAPATTVTAARAAGAAAVARVIGSGRRVRIVTAAAVRMTDYFVSDGFLMVRCQQFLQGDDERQQKGDFTDDQGFTGQKGD